MSLEVDRLYYGHIDGPWGFATLHGYLIKHPQHGVVLVDTGLGGPLNDFKSFPLFARTVDDALADHGLAVADVTAVITTHLHQDHFGHNVVLKGKPFHIQHTELERGREQEAHLADFFDFAGAKFEELEGDAEVFPGVKVIATPGHTSGHQSVLVEGDKRVLLTGDAAFGIDIWDDPDGFDESHGSWSGQIQNVDPEVWRDSLHRLRKLEPDLVHFCHDGHVVGNPATGDSPIPVPSDDEAASEKAWGPGGARKQAT
jgi:N-acyl homoserine lactone hydrolase